jgi:uncharacterized protein YdhG (YjbR/CyaY superfamily)
MAEMKTTRTGASVAEFLHTVEDEQVRRDCQALIDLMSVATGSKPEMWGPSIIGFGTYQLQYSDGREIPWMQIGFSPRAQNIALYLGCGYPQFDELVAALGKHSRAKSCLYIKRLADVHVPTLQKLLQASVARFGVTTPPTPAARRSGKTDSASRTPAGRPAGTARAGRMAAASAKSVEAYLAALSADKRAALEKLRRDIKAAAPRAEECISYGIPAVRLNGKVLVHFGAATKHCAFYPGAVIAAFADELAGYDTSKGTIRFPPNRPLPATLVRTLVKAQIARRAARR